VKEIWIRSVRPAVALPPDAFLQPTREGERFLQSQKCLALDFVLAANQKYGKVALREWPFEAIIVLTL